MVWRCREFFFSNMFGVFNFVRPFFYICYFLGHFLFLGIELCAQEMGIAGFSAQERGIARFFPPRRGEPPVFPPRRGESLGFPPRRTENLSGGRVGWGETEDALTRLKTPEGSADFFDFLFWSGDHCRNFWWSKINFLWSEDWHCIKNEFVFDFKVECLIRRPLRGLEAC